MQDEPARMLPTLSPKELARMARTTRSNVDFFMKKFKNLGFISDEGGLTVNSALLSVVLHK
jgi:hypothetical protein